MSYRKRFIPIISFLLRAALILNHLNLITMHQAQSSNSSPEISTNDLTDMDQNDDDFEV